MPHFLAEICRNTELQVELKKTRQWPSSAISLSFVLHATCAKAYRFVKRSFALPSIALMYKRMSAIIKFNENNLLAIKNIPRAVERWGYQWDIGPNEIVHAVLTGDAAVFNPEMFPQFPSPKPSDNMHLFMVLPLNPRLRSFVVHPVSHLAVSLRQKGGNYSQDITELLKQSTVHIVSFSNDGDRGHYPYQTSMLSRSEELFFSRCDIVTCCVVAFDRDDAPDPLNLVDRRLFPWTKIPMTQVLA
jgi:hypothetical protein